MKPIAGRNQYPFTIGGIMVDGAKINGFTFVEELYIFQQRSYNTYDLVSSNGTVYEYVEITWKNTNNKDLDYYENSTDLVSTIKNNSFFMKIEDPKENIYGFITLIQLNKIKVHTGKYVYRREDSKSSLVDIHLSPTLIYAYVGDVIEIDIDFQPSNYENKNGNWILSTNNILRSLPERSTTTKQFFECLYEGAGYAIFIPSANQDLSASCTVIVQERPDPKPVLEDFVVSSYYLSVPDNLYFGYQNYYPGDIAEFVAVGIPSGSVLDEPLTVTFDSEFDELLELVHSDDPMVYKLRVKPSVNDIPWPDEYSPNFWQVTLTFSNSMKSYQEVMYITDFVKLDQDVGVIGQLQMAVGYKNQLYVISPTSYQYGYIWHSVNEDIATVDQDGLVTGITQGTAKIQCLQLDQDGNPIPSLGYIEMVVWDNIPEMIRYSPHDKFTYEVGEVQQFTYEKFPSTSVIPSTAYWGDVRSSDDTRYAKITRDGLLTAVSANTNPSDYNTYFTCLKPNIPVVGNQPYNKNFGIAIVQPGQTYEPVSYRLNREGDLFIAVDKPATIYAFMLPYWTTGSKLSDIVITGDDDVLRVETDPYYMNTTSGFPLTLVGLKKGHAVVTISAQQKPSVTKQFNVYII